MAEIILAWKQHRQKEQRSTTKAVVKHWTKRDIPSHHINSSLLQETENLLFFFQEFTPRNKVRIQLDYLFICFSRKTLQHYQKCMEYLTVLGKKSLSHFQISDFKSQSLQSLSIKCCI